MRQHPYIFAIKILLYTILLTRQQISIKSMIKQRIIINHTILVKILYILCIQIQIFKETLILRDPLLVVLTLGNRAVGQRSVKQYCTANSTVEVEYMAVLEATKRLYNSRSSLQNLRWFVMLRCLLSLLGQLNSRKNLNTTNKENLLRGNITQDGNYYIRVKSFLRLHQQKIQQIHSPRVCQLRASRVVYMKWDLDKYLTYCRASWRLLDLYVIIMPIRQQW